VTSKLMTACGPWRHFASRINCVALGAKRTSASWVTRPDLRCVFGQSGSRAPRGARTHFGSPWADLRCGNCRRPRFQNSGVKLHRRRSASISVLPGGPAKTDGRGMPPDDSAESAGERLEARYPAAGNERKRVHGALRCSGCSRGWLLRPCHVWIGCAWLSSDRPR
jgi:hypothetical protein